MFSDLGQPDRLARWACEIAINDSQLAFKQLFVSYYSKLVRFASFYTGVDDAEDCVSEAFLSIWENRKKLIEVQNIEAYLYSVVKNKAISNFRKGKGIQVDLEDNGVDLFACTETTPEDELISKEAVKRINHAINLLPNKCKLAFKLVREDKMKYKEAAQIMGISVKTLEAHITLAIKKIRQALER